MNKYWLLIRSNKLLEGSLVMALGSLAAGALNYLFHLAVGRMVDAETYGEAVSIISIFQMVSFPAGVLGIIAVWYTAGDKVIGEVSGTYEKLKVFIFRLLKYGTPFLAVLFLATPFLMKFLKIENYWVLNIIWIAAFFSVFLGWSNGVVNGLQKFKESSYAGVFGVLMKLLIGLSLIKIGLGTIGVSAGILAGAFFSFLFIFWVLKSAARKDEKNRFREAGLPFRLNIKKYAGFAFFSFFFFNLLISVDMILAKHQLVGEEAGYYGALLIAAKVIIFITGSIAGVFFSMSSEENHQNKKGDKIFWQTAWLIGTICLVFCLFYFLFPEFILKLFFGQTYLSQAPRLFWFALLSSGFSLSGVVFYYFLSKERLKELLAISIIPVVEVAFLYIFGHNITSIVLIAIAAQALFFLSGVALILIGGSGGNKKYEHKAYLNRCSDIQ